MIRDVLINRWVLGGVGFLILLSVGCVWWYYHDTAPDRKAAAEAQEMLRQSVLSQKTDRHIETEKTDDLVSVEGETLITEKPITDTTQANETTNEETNDDNDAITDISKPVRMSPNGFGAFPEIPEGAPIALFDENMSAQQELLGRVLVKLWNEGDTRIGGGYINGDTYKVYPYYPNVIYVKYENEFNVLTGRYETKITQAGSSFENFDAVKSVTRGEIPSGYILIDSEESGINAYEYLDLP